MPLTSSLHIKATCCSKEVISTHGTTRSCQYLIHKLANAYLGRVFEAGVFGFLPLGAMCCFAGNSRLKGGGIGGMLNSRDVFEDAALLLFVLNKKGDNGGKPC